MIQCVSRSAQGFSPIMLVYPHFVRSPVIRLTITRCANHYFEGNSPAYNRQAVLVLDYIETFPTEIYTLWSRGLRSGSAILFIINRYGFLASQIMLLYVSTPGTSGDNV